MSIYKTMPKPEMVKVLKEIKHILEASDDEIMEKYKFITSDDLDSERSRSRTINGLVAVEIDFLIDYATGKRLWLK